MVDLSLGAKEDCVCPFEGFRLTTCCVRVTTAAAATTATAVRLVVAAVMVTAKVRMMAMAW
jgi:hypothetical protein